MQAQELVYFSKAKITAGTWLIGASLTLTLAPAWVHAERSSPPESSQDVLLKQVKGFYAWAKENQQSILALEPSVKYAKNSTTFYLDLSTLEAFTSAFARSGYFTSDFPRKIDRYYRRYQQEFSRIKTAEFDQMHKDGGPGPLMETQDMDIFFCAQEYEYKASYIDAMKIGQSHLRRGGTWVDVVSPYAWTTRFHFRKEHSRWLISAYCVYQ